MQDLLPDRLLARRVPQGDIGIEPDRNRTLAGIEPVDLRMVGGAEFDETLQADTALRDPLGKQDRQPRLDAGNAVGHPAKGGAALWVELALRIVVAKRAMVGGEGLEHAGADPLPDRIPAFVITRRGVSKRIWRRSSHRRPAPPGDLPP